MDASTQAELIAVLASLHSAGGFRCDLDHTSEATAPLTQPALILRGRHDRSIPIEHARRLKTLCSNREVVDLEADTHFI